MGRMASPPPRAVLMHRPAPVLAVFPSPRISPSCVRLLGGSHKAGRRLPAAPERGHRFAAAVIAFQPAVLYDSAVWAQTDAAVTVAMVASILLVACRRPALGWAV